MDYYHKYSVTVEDYPDEEDSEMQSFSQTMNNEASTFDYSRLNNDNGGVLDQKNSWDEVNKMEQVARKEKLNDSTAIKNANKVAHIIQDDYLQQKNL
ncbi:unnamed protein product [Cunninghamella echinulata]